MNKGFIYIAFTALVFSSLEIVGKMLSATINPYQITFLRFLIGGAILLPFAVKELKRKELILKFDDIAFFTLTGFINIVISMSLIQLSLLYTKASITAAIFSTNSVFTIPLAWLILKEKLTGKMLVSIVVSILGILFIFNPFALSPDLKGIGLAIAAAVAFSLFGVISKTRIEKYGGLVLNSFSFIIGDILLLLFLLYFGNPITAGITYGNIGHILYLSIFVTALGYLSYFEAMKLTSAITTSMVFLIKPALAPLLSFLILGEILKVNALLGIALIIVGAVTAFLKPNAKSNQPSAEPDTIE